MTASAFPNKRPIYPKGILHVVAWARATGPNIGPFGRHILTVLSYHADEDGWCRPGPSQETIAAEANCTRQAVSRMTKILVGLGLVETHKVDIEEGRFRYDYQLMGELTAWVPTPIDPEQEPNTDAAFTSVVRGLKDENTILRKELEEREAGNKRLAQLLMEKAPELGNQDALRNEIAQRSEVVVSPSSNLDQNRPTTTTLPVSPSHFVPPADSPSETEEGYATSLRTTIQTATDLRRPPFDFLKARRNIVRAWVDSEWEDIKSQSPDGKGWRDKDGAVRWLTRNYATTEEPDDFSFVEQVKIQAEAKEHRAETAANMGHTPDHPVFPSMNGQPAPEREKAQEIWRTVLGELQRQLPRSAFQTWLKQTDGLHVDETRFYVEAPTAFAVTWLERRMYNAIQKAVELVTEKPLEVHFAVAQSQGHDA